MSSARSLSTLIDRKEMAEESRFIRAQEDKRNALLQARMEKIMAQEDTNAEKKELLGLLAEKSKDDLEGERLAKTGIFNRMGLNDWKVAVPFAMLLSVGPFNAGMIEINGEFQLAAAFIFFVGTVWKVGGPMLSAAMDSEINEIRDDMKALDESALATVHSAITATEHNLGMKDDLVALQGMTDAMAAAQAEALTLAEEHKYREAVIKKLDSLSALEEAASGAIRNRMLKQIKTEVVDTFTNDKKFKENALNQAIAVLSGGAGAKQGKDIVGEAFVSALSNYRTVYAKQDPKQDVLLVQLEKDMAAVAEAPVVEAKGGNVYASIGGF
jgi:hypothetical protein